MGRRLAVVIANDSYRDARLPRLHAPTHEARELRDLLRDPEVGAFEPAELHVNESKAEIEQALEQTFRAAGPGDLVLLYFSGHGVRSGRRRRLHLAVSNTDLDLLAATSISATFVKELIAESAADSTVLLLDCCYSGAFTDGAQLDKSQPALDLGDELQAGRGVYVLTASTSVEQAADGYPSSDEVVLSAFTEAVVRGLASGAADVRGTGRISPADLGDYVLREVPQRTDRQTPTQYGYVEEEVQLARVRSSRGLRTTDGARVHLADLVGPLTQSEDRGLRAESRARGQLVVPIGQVRQPGGADGEPLELDLAGPDGHVLIVGRMRSGKTTLLRTLVGGLALTHGPDEVEMYLLESGGNGLGLMRPLPHVGGSAGEDQTEAVAGVLDHVTSVVQHRKRLFHEFNVDASGGFWTIRNQIPDGPHPDVFLFVDAWQEFGGRYPEVFRAVRELASAGLDYGVHVVATARRWADVPEELRELIPCQIELRLSRPASSQIDPRLAEQLPEDPPGWGLRGRRRFRAALPSLRTAPPVDAAGDGYVELGDGAQELVSRLGHGAPAAPAAGGQVVPRAMPLSVSVDLLELMRLDEPGRLDPLALWSDQSPDEELRIPIGPGADGRPVLLDLKESARGGVGPHGLITGATGSGKSELLRTIVLALALRHSSERVNMVLIDFKGGATFNPLGSLPHTSAVITNLADEVVLVDRMTDALTGEIVRRQEFLRRAGVPAQADYQRVRQQNPSLPPLPSLVVICDEFAELLAVRPDFIDMFVQIGRLGRSLGVHLLLASQRLEEGRLRGLETHLSYRIALRTFSAMESRAALGVPDAYELPNAPGHGYLKTDGSTMTRFRAATCSNIRPAAVAGEPGRSVLELAAERMAGRGPAAHQVWIPPLSEPWPLSALLPTLAADPRRGLCPVGWQGLGALTVPVGVLDKPFEQRRDLMWADLSGAAGHVAVVGGPQSGKSTLLRTLIAGLALTHTPREAQFFCLDFGGGSLSALAGLPHVSGVAGRLEPDAVRRTVAEVRTILDEREALFVEQGIGSMSRYRSRRRAGEFGGDPFGDVFLVVDGWGSVRDTFEEHAAAITDLAARGLGYGVHVVVSASRWSELRLSIRDLLGTRFELRLGDPADSEVDRRTAANVPAGSPGRGLSAERMHFLTAIPRIDGRNTPEDLTDGVAHLVDAVRGAWPGASAPPVRLLPAQVGAAEVLARRPAAPGGVVLGLGEQQLEPVAVDLLADPHLYAIGDVESGKTNLLRLIATQLVATHTPSEARLIIVDYRRALLDVVSGDHLIGYAPSATSAQTMMRDVAGVMAKRLPRADLSPDQLRNRTWWSGPDLYVLVDDYDVVVSSATSPLAELRPFLAQARDVGLHLILTHRSGGASRAMYEPVIQALRELSSPTLLLSSSREEGVLAGGVRARPYPPGRGMLVRRKEGNELIQVAWQSD
ncbi:MAG TPA: type VII secretion protein EccCb [Actinocatenispora sp.]